MDLTLVVLKPTAQPPTVIPYQLFQQCSVINWNIGKIPYWLNDPLSKGHSTFDLSINIKFCGPYRTMAMQFYLLKKTTSV